MNLLSLKVLRLRSLYLLLVVMICAFWPSHYLKAQDGRLTRTSSGLTILSTQVYTPADGGDPRLSGTHCRYQRSDGSWKDIKTYDNRKLIMFGIVGRGVFQVDEINKQLILLSPLPLGEGVKIISEDPSGQEDRLRRSAQFVREETVLGYKTFVLRSSESGTTEYDETYIAPALQGLSIKYVHISKEGMEVIEPTKIEVGELEESNFTLPDYSINYAKFERKIQENEPFRPEIAEQMRRQLQELQKQDPRYSGRKEEVITDELVKPRNTSPPSVQTSNVVKVSGGVLQGMAIKRVQPPYPTVAKEAGVSGSVRVQIVVSEEGEVIEATVGDGPELLRDGALQAARMWVFRPTLDRGKPVKVQGILTFNFVLQ